MATTPFDALLAAITAWATADPDIQAVLLVGSHARDTARPDSDIDLVILTTAADRYILDHAWAALFGTVVSSQVEPYGLLTSVRVHYQDSPEVEFGFTTPAWIQEPLDDGTRAVLRGGAKVIYDRSDECRRVVSSVTGVA